MAKQIKSSDLFEEEDIFKGLRDSAQKTIDVFDKLSNGMKQSAEEMKKSVSENVLTTTKSIENLMKTSTNASKLQEDSIKIDKAKAEALRQYAIAEQHLEKIEQEKEKTNQQKIKTAEQVKKAEEAEIKRANAKAKAANVETNAYKVLSAQARDLKNESKNLAAELYNQKNAGLAGTDSFNKLQQQYHEVTAEASRLDTQLKDIDRVVGDNQRSVGDYGKATVGLKGQLRKLTQALAEMDESDPRFQKMAMEAGELKDKIQDTQAVVKSLAGSAVENLGGGFAKVGKIGVDAFQGVESAGVLLGMNTDQLMQTMVRLQALAGLSDALESLGGLGDKMTEIKAAFIGAASKLGLFTAAKEVDVVVTETQAIVTGEAAVAQEGLNVAMKANPIGMVIAGVLALGAAIAGLIYYFDSETEAEKKAAVEAKKLAEQKKYMAKYSKEAAEFVGKETGSYASLIYSLKATTAGSKERETIMKQINSEYGTTLKNLSDEFKFQEQLNRSVEDYLSVQYNKFKIQKNQEYFDYQQKKRFELEQTQAKLMQDFDQKRQKAGENRLVFLSGQEKQIKTTDILAANETLDSYSKRYPEFAKSLLEVQGALAENESATLSLGVRREQLLQTDQKLTNNGKVYTKQESANKSATTTQKKLNTEFELSNEYLTKQIELLNTLEQLKIAENASNQQTAIDDQKANDLKRISETGQLEVDTIEKLVADKYQIVLDGIKAQRDAQIDAINETYRQERIAQRKQLGDKHRELLSQEGLTVDQKKKIEENYQAELIKIADDEAQRAKDLATELEIVNKETNVKIVEQEAQKNSEIDGINTELNDAQKEYYDKQNEKVVETNSKILENTAKTNEEIRKIVDQTAEFFIKKSEEKITQIDKEKNAAQKQFDFYQDLAKTGNINAEQSLAEQQKIIDKSELKKAKELKRQQRIKLAQSIYSTYSAKVDSGSKTPLVDTIKDTTLLMQFINSLPTFYDGTEDTGTNGKGLDNKGGFHAILHPNERVVPKNLNDKLNGISNEDLTKLATEYNNGNIVHKGQANQMSSALEFGLMIEKLDKLNETIQNKPEHSYDVGRISSTLLEFVDQKKQGNTTTYNRYKVRK